jgi:hypothetical protein
MADQPEDLYEGDSPAPDKPESSEGDKPKEDEGGKTFLVPSEICPGMKVGEEMVTRIEAIHDEQYEISYAPEKKGSQDEESKPMAEASEAGEGGGGEANSMYS